MPVALRRNFTLRGSSSFTQWPLINIAASQRVMLLDNVTLTLQDLLLYGIRKDHFMRAPGLDLLAASPPGTRGAYITARNVSALAEACYPGSLVAASHEAVVRPAALPGPQRWLVGEPQEGCTNTNTGLGDLARRCWPRIDLELDFALTGADIDVTGMPQPNNYLVQLQYVRALCRVLVSPDCIRDLGSPIGCMLLAMQNSSLPPLTDVLPLATGGSGGAGDGGGGGGVVLTGGVAEQGSDGGRGGGGTSAWPIIVGCVVGGGVLAVAALAAMLLVRRARRQRRGSSGGGGSKGGLQASDPACAPACGPVSSKHWVARPSEDVESGPCQRDSAGAHGPSMAGDSTGTAGCGGHTARGSGGAAPAAPPGPMHPLGSSSDTTGSHELTCSSPHPPHPRRPRASAEGEQAAMASAVADDWADLVAEAGAGPGRGGQGSSGLPGFPHALAFPAAVRVHAREGPSLQSPFRASENTAASAGAGGPEPDNSGCLGRHSAASNATAGSGPLWSGACAQAEVVTLLPTILGKGAFGRVQEGLYQGRKVAVKMILEAINDCVGGDTAQRTASIVQELETLARCEHPNVVKLLAASLAPPRPFVVLEHMDYSLDRLLYGGGKASGDARPGVLPLETVLHVAREVAQGLEYLHPHILHRDLKPANILLRGARDDLPVVKISDFGLARFRGTILVTNEPEAGTAAYVAPECFDPEVLGITYKADMYSYGVVLWEMLAGVQPWSGMSPIPIALQVAMHNRRLAVPPPNAPGSCPSRWPPKLVQIIEECFDKDPLRRPAAAEVAKRIALLIQLLEHGPSASPRPAVPVVGASA
ncbi:hypothetical protein HYH03_012924 [Edaphochlamys debaryana]|uniref:Protein kinase domain-containing protein n=1 Tax=Edaphochlamys debaryana TaxID=47281 RepID=A0A836BU06_9CHLO|nr:hypothetical protein HYH03_012924 [Edaphochlamys debaryana]|eukprot:KAG2488607.1 hypothetical protein HYH03_012924 [Edaphochlamys debaryana]